MITPKLKTEKLQRAIVINFCLLPDVSAISLDNGSQTGQGSLHQQRMEADQAIEYAGKGAALAYFTSL